MILGFTKTISTPNGIVKTGFVDKINKGIKLHTVRVDELEWFAINDGFDTMDKFWDWFDHLQPFKGRIIHWTELRY
jgi:hypothetical protein